MGGRAPAAAEAPKPIEPPKPVPIPDANANPDRASTDAKPSFATQQEAQNQQNQDKKGLGATMQPSSVKRRTQRDPATAANSAGGGSLGSPAVITG